MKKLLSLFVVVITTVMLSATACAAVPEVREDINEVTVSNIADGDFAIAAVYNKIGVLEENL